MYSKFQIGVISSKKSLYTKVKSRKKIIKCTYMLTFLQTARTSQEFILTSIERGSILPMFVFCHEEYESLCESVEKRKQACPVSSDVSKLKQYTRYETKALSWKPPTIFVRLDFLQCVQICIFFKTQICLKSVPIEFLVNQDYSDSDEKI